MRLLFFLLLFGTAFTESDGIYGELIPFDVLNEPAPRGLYRLSLLCACFCFALCYFNPMKHVKCFQSTWMQVVVLALISWVVMAMPLYIVQRYVASKLDSIKVIKAMETTDERKRLEDALGFKVCVQYAKEGQIISFLKKPGRLQKVQQIVKSIPSGKPDNEK